MCVIVSHVISPERIFVPALFLMFEQVHTQPAVTTTSSTTDKPDSAPRASMGICVVLVSSYNIALVVALSLCWLGGEGGQV